MVRILGVVSLKNLIGFWKTNGLEMHNTSVAVECSAGNRLKVQTPQLTDPKGYARKNKNEKRWVTEKPLSLLFFLSFLFFCLFGTKS